LEEGEEIRVHLYENDSSSRLTRVALVAQFVECIAVTPLPRDNAGSTPG